MVGVGPVDLALRVRIQALALHGLETVAGIGPFWSVAAMASARTEAKGLLSVPPAEVGSFLGPLPVDELYGIHRAQAAQLRGLESTRSGSSPPFPLRL